MLADSLLPGITEVSAAQGGLTVAPFQNNGLLCWGCGPLRGLKTTMSCKAPVQRRLSSGSSENRKIH